MKLLLLIFAMFFSTLIYAQGNKPKNINNPVPVNAPANTPNVIQISPATKTTIISQPQSMPGSNMNPITGTVISLKANKRANAVAATVPAKPIANKKSKAAIKKNKKIKVRKNN
jgi:hypothetical protein